MGGWVRTQTAYTGAQDEPAEDQTHRIWVPFASRSRPFFFFFSASSVSCSATGWVGLGRIPYRDGHTKVLAIDPTIERLVRGSPISPAAAAAAGGQVVRRTGGQEDRRTGGQEDKGQEDKGQEDKGQEDKRICCRSSLGPGHAH